MIETHLPGGTKHPQAVLDGTTLTVAEHAIDLAARQADVQVVIDLSRDGGEIVEQTGPRMVATIVIPPATYSLVDTGETDPITGDTLHERQRDALDTDKVELRLFPEE